MFAPQAYSGEIESLILKYKKALTGGGLNPQIMEVRAKSNENNSANKLVNK